MESSRTRRAIAVVLAVALAIESISVVLATTALASATSPIAADPPAGEVLAADSGARTADAPAAMPARIVVVAARPVVAALPAEDRLPASAPVAIPDPAAEAEARAKARAERQAARTERQERREAARREREAARREREAAREARAVRAGRERDRDRRAAPDFRGRNHVWIPSLGIDRSIQWFPCERAREPDNFMYRWGCAGRNNVYLMGHAHSVMRPLHDAYVGGRLRKGMKVWYADSTGRVRTYAVRWWRVTRPTTDAAWAWAPQDVPSMTLQTCVGRNSQHRLMVRLIEVR